MKKLVVFGILTTAVVSTFLPPDHRAKAQSGSRGTGRRAGVSFETRFWNYLGEAQYTNWAPSPGQSDGFQKGGSPHGAFVKMYLNRTAAGNPKKPPYGSIIVKENYGPMKKKLMAVTVMYRVKGYNPKGGDWYWVKYMPNGTVAAMKTPKGRMRLAGKLKGCIECHSGSAGDDYTFFNDKP